MKTTAVAVVVSLLGFLIGNVWVFVQADMFVRYFYEARMALAIWIPGLIAMLTGFATWSYRLAAVGTSLIFAAVVVFLVVLLTAIPQSRSGCSPQPSVKRIDLFFLVVGLGVASVAILAENVATFRLGWSLWLAGITGFATGLLRLGRQLRSVLQR